MSDEVTRPLTGEDARPDALRSPEPLATLVEQRKRLIAQLVAANDSRAHQRNELEKVERMVRSWAQSVERVENEMAQIGVALRTVERKIERAARGEAARGRGA